MFALVCTEKGYAPKYTKTYHLICGAYATKKEAREANKGIKDCFLPHIIMPCEVIIREPEKK